jgi:ParB-like chromosome segregation protein Spo0J
MPEDYERYLLLPIEECIIHPLARIRFDYPVSGLVESIAAVGQVQPGKALQASAKGSGRGRNQVYIGLRRLIACEELGLKHFKALVVSDIDEGRIQREILSENTKRANLSVLEELNLLANYSKGGYSLNDLARDMGLSPRLVRGRVNVAVQLQGKGLIETFYRVEKVSGFTFTYRHIEEIAALEEEDRWLPVSIQAAEHNWKAEQIGTLGTRLATPYLIQALPEWGRQFVKQTSAQTAGSTSAATSNAATNGQHGGVSLPPTTTTGGGQAVPATEDHSRYQTVTDSSRFLICPSCGSESPVEFPVYPQATRFIPGKVDRERSAVPLAKKPVPLVAGLSSMKCVNEECGKTLTFAQDLLGDGQPLLRSEELLSLISGALQAGDGGVGSLVWDGKKEAWLKVTRSGQGEAAYLAYDERAGSWTIPVSVGEQQKARAVS